MSSPLAMVDQVSLRLGARDVLRDVSAAITPGEIVALVGPNGAGKSSLLKLLAGIIAPTSGRVLLDGRPMTDMTAAEIASHIAYLPQSRAIHWPMPARAIVALGRLPLQLRGRTSHNADATAISTAMAEMDVTAFADRPVLALSGGEQARVLMARALAQQPNVLIADEPTAGLDLGHQLTLMQVLRRRADAGGASIVALHDLGLAARFADRVLLLADGHIVASGPPATVLTSSLIKAVYGVDMVVTAVDGIPVFVPRAPSTTNPMTSAAV